MTLENRRQREENTKTLRTGMPVRAFAIVCLFASLFFVLPSPAHAACHSPLGEEGSIVYNADQRSMQYCNGNDWIVMGQGGTGGSVGGAGWVQIEPGTSHACGIKTDNTVWCWGSNSNSQLGNIGSVSAIVPRLSGEGTKDWADVTTINASTCAIKTDGTLWCWGADTSGLRGDGGGVGGNTATPQQEATLATNWKDVDMDGYTSDVHACAIKTDGTIWCWGNGSEGELGNGTTTATQDTPVQEATTATDWQSLAVGEDHACAIKTGGTLWCWGSDGSGQLGNGATTGVQDTPVQEATAATDWNQVSAAWNHTCAIKTDGTLWCWGRDDEGQLGNGATTGDQDTPVQEATAATDWAMVSAEGRQTCAIKTDGTLWCWGWDHIEQLGDGPGATNQNAPVQEATAATDWIAVTASTGDTTCGIKSNGTFSCWGNGNIDGDPFTGYTQSPNEIAVGGNDWSMVATGDKHTCAIKSDGTLWCWGLDNVGQLGNGAAASQNHIPVHEATLSTNWNSVSAEAGYTCAVRSDGTLWCWGHDDYGVLGNGATTGNQNAPVQEVTAATDWKQVSTGLHHACAVKTGGTLWCWGRDHLEQLGDGPGAADRDSPVQEATLSTNWDSVSAGDRHACGVKTNGTLWCWGSDADGRLGNGATTGTQDTPVQEATLSTNWDSVSAGDMHACGVKTNGTLWCWGSDADGKLGNGATTGNQDTPVQESTGATNWADVHTGDEHTCARRTDNTLWCWGSDRIGALGNGLEEAGDKDSPQQILTGATALSVTTSYGGTCAIMYDLPGQIYCWGRNESGSNGLPIYSDTPPDVISSCVGPYGQAGDMLYNASENIPQFCDSVNWVAVGK